jgi:hypothetical protein
VIRCIVSKLARTLTIPVLPYSAGLGVWCKSITELLLCNVMCTNKLVATGSLLHKAHLIAAVPLTDSSLQTSRAVSPALAVRSEIAGSGKTAAIERLSLPAVVRDPGAIRVADARLAAQAAALITDQGSQESTS